MKLRLKYASCSPRKDFFFYLILMSLLNKVNTEKGKLPEKAGHKATGLSPFQKDIAAGLPGEYSTFQKMYFASKYFWKVL